MPLQTFKPGDTLVVAAGTTSASYIVDEQTALSIVIGSTSSLFQTTEDSENSVIGGTATWTSQFVTQITTGNPAIAFVRTFTRRAIFRVVAVQACTITSYVGDEAVSLFVEEASYTDLTVDEILTVGSIIAETEVVETINIKDNADVIRAGIDWSGGASGWVRVTEGQTQDPEGLSVGNFGMGGVAPAAPSTFIPDTIGGAIIDAEARATLALILDALSIHGIMASS